MHPFTYCNSYYHSFSQKTMSLRNWLCTLCIIFHNLTCLLCICCLYFLLLLHVCSTCLLHCKSPSTHILSAPVSQSANTLCLLLLWDITSTKHPAWDILLSCSICKVDVKAGLLHKHQVQIKMEATCSALRRASNCLSDTCRNTI